jgi:hypothetical protein
LNAVDIVPELRVTWMGTATVPVNVEELSALSVERYEYVPAAEKRYRYVPLFNAFESKRGVLAGPKPSESVAD